MPRKIYLEDIPLEEAWHRLIGALEAAGRWSPLPGEDVPLDQALGRVTAAPVWARLSAPHYHAAAMDGYAVRAHDTQAAAETAPVLLALRDQAHYLDTGDPLPAWADAVIPIENVQPVEAGGQKSEVRGPNPAGSHDRRIASRPHYPGAHSDQGRNARDAHVVRGALCGDG